MTRIGDRGAGAGAATEAKQDTIITTLENKRLNRTVTTAIDAQVFDNVTTTVTSSTIDLASYREFLLLIDLAVADAPTDIVIEVLVSDDDKTYYKYMRGPFGDLRYEDSAGDLTEAIGDKAPARYMQIKATATGTDATKKFTLTVKVAQID